MSFTSTKTYKDLGPVAYRQWRAESHCNLIHGYSLSFHVEFEADELDARNWVVDFGSLRSFKDNLEDWFDHTLLVAEDDPDRDAFEMLAARGLAKLTYVEKTGCEGISKFLYEYLEEIWLPENGYKPRVRVKMVEVREIGANSARYSGVDAAADIIATVTDDVVTVTADVAAASSYSVDTIIVGAAPNVDLNISTKGSGVVNPDSCRFTFNTSPDVSGQMITNISSFHDENNNFNPFGLASTDVYGPNKELFRPQDWATVATPIALPPTETDTFDGTKITSNG